MMGGQNLGPAVTLGSGVALARNVRINQSSR